MLNPKVYRAAFIPVVFALIVAGFSFGKQPVALDTTFAPDAFNGQRATTTLDTLVRDFPSRPPGSASDNRLASRMADEFASADFSVSRRSFTGRTAIGKKKLRNIIATRPGISDRQIVVVAHRDALERGSRAELSGTASLLELAKIFSGRKLAKTLVLVSTSGGSGGDAGTRELASELTGHIDAGIVVGDIAGLETRKPLVVPWSTSVNVTPLTLRRTVEEAVRREVGGPPGSSNAVAQFFRLAFPATLTEQGALLADDFPATLLQARGERGPQADTPISGQRFERFGRALLRTITALDGAPAQRESPRALVVAERKVLPEWAVTLVALALLIPSLLAVVDGIARVRRRGEKVLRWFGWVALTTLPFLVACGFIWLLGFSGLLTGAVSQPLPAGALSLDTGGYVSLSGVVLVFLLCWLGLRTPLLRFFNLKNPYQGAAAACAVGLSINLLAVITLVVNPYGALLLVPAAHLWLLAVAPETRVHPITSLVMTVVGFVVPLAVAGYYAVAFAYGPLELVYSIVLLIGGSGLTLGSLFGGSLFFGLFICAASISLKGESTDQGGVEITTRGPVGFAGPGSLGGTDSAIR